MERENSAQCDRDGGTRMAPPAPSCVLLRAGLRAYESAVGPRFDAFPGRNPVA